MYVRGVCGTGVMLTWRLFCGTILVRQVEEAQVSDGTLVLWTFYASCDIVVLMNEISERGIKNDRANWILVCIIHYSRKDLTDVFHVWYDPIEKFYYSGWLANDLNRYVERIRKHDDESVRARTASVIQLFKRYGWDYE